MSTTIIAVIVNVLTMVLPLIGIDAGTEALTTFVQVGVAVATGLWIWIQRVRKGDVNFAGLRK